MPLKISLCDSCRVRSGERNSSTRKEEGAEVLNWTNYLVHLPFAIAYFFSYTLPQAKYSLS